MVERNVFGSNLRRFLAPAATGVMMGLLSRVTNAEKVTSYDEQVINAQEQNDGTNLSYDFTLDTESQPVPPCLLRYLSRLCWWKPLPC
jgi:hypothetical protein